MSRITQTFEQLKQELRAFAESTDILKKETPLIEKLRKVDSFMREHGVNNVTLDHKQREEINNTVDFTYFGTHLTPRSHNLHGLRQKPKHTVRITDTDFKELGNMVKSANAGKENNGL